MPATWCIPGSDGGLGPSLDLRAVSMLLDAPRDPTPTRAMLRFLNALLPVDYISLVSHAEDTPALLEGHAYGSALRNVTGLCFEQYRRHFYVFDAAIRIAAALRAQAGASETVTALRFRAGEIPDAGWRHRIYEREHLSDRLTLLFAPVPRTAFSINLYRSEAMGPFAAQEIERVLAVAPLLRQVHRHAAAGGAGTRPMGTRVALARARLLDAGAARLSGRELEVCARIACGMSADGIACDLDIAPSSVATLRKRAYLKLGIHDRAELVRLAA
jgi:DNA-binding CsgD family transcriptional regulator